jgi:hypothetical protein
MNFLMIKKNQLEQVYGGDTEGSIHRIVMEKTWENDSVFKIDKTNLKIHRC